MDESGRVCARCGIAVAAGYPRCPRCHADLPAARARPSTSPIRGAGGTVVEPGANRNLILAIAGGAVVIALVAWLVMRDDDAPAGAPVAEEDLGDDTTEDDDDTTEAPSPAPVPSPSIPSPSEPAPGPNPGGAVSGLAGQLRDARLWATVSGDGDRVMIDSAFCDDAGLGSIVDGAAAELKEAGFTGIRCKAPHGGIIFERSL